MSWFFVDDGFYDHPKLAKLPPARALAAVGLWTMAGTWSRKKLTGGFVPLHQVAKLGGNIKIARDLVECGLWLDVEGGFRFHEWEHWQETTDEVEHKRELGRQRAQKWRASRSRNAVTNALVTANEQRTNASVTHGVRSAYRDPSPSPSPSPSLASQEGERASAPPEAAPPSETQTHEKPVAIEPREVTRFRQPLEDAVRAQFFARRATPQKASPQQWRDGCQTVQDALDLKAYPSADRAIEEFAKRIVDACARGERLGFALQQVPLAEPVKPADAPALSSITADGRTKHVW